LGKVRVAIIGVGNCASSLVQGVHFYRDAAEDSFVPGLMHVNLGGYHIRDVEISAAFDVDTNKVGKDVSEAIFIPPNNTYKFSDVPHLGVPVHRGMTHDGLGRYLKQVITKGEGPTDDIVHILKDTGTDVVVNFLPVGSEMATKWYVEQILEAGCALVNCIPVFIAREPYWQGRFEERGLPVIGDDIKSQVGATIVHRVPHPPVPGPRRATGADRPTQRRRQHGFLQHAGARPVGIQEDLQDQCRHLPTRLRHR